jgi:hypothetical protein
MLKLIVSRDGAACVGISGTFDHPDLEALLHRLYADSTEHSALEDLQEASADGTLEFVAAFVPGEALWVVHRGDKRKVADGLLGWAGDHTAFESFREFEARSTSHQMHERFEMAMADVASANALGSVGGPFIRCSAIDGSRFSYYVQTIVDLGDVVRLKSGLGGLTAANPSSGEYLQIAYRSVSDEPVVAYWFPQSATGFVLAPLVSLDSLRIGPTSEQDFVLQAGSFAGTELEPSKIFRNRLVLG